MSVFSFITSSIDGTELMMIISKKEKAKIIGIQILSRLLAKNRLRIKIVVRPIETKTRDSPIDQY